MNIFGDYNTDLLFLDEPCFIPMCGLIYPLRVKENIGFQEKFAGYLIYNKQYINKAVPIDNISYLRKLMILNIDEKSRLDDFGERMMNEEQAYYKVIDELQGMLSLVTKKNIKFTEDENKDICFTDDERSISITEANFEIVRKVIVMQNLIPEVEFYEDLEYAELMAEARRKRNKDLGIKPTEFIEIVAYVKSYSGLTYEEILKQNVFQLYADYYCLHQREDYRTAMNFKLVSTEVPKLTLIEPFIQSLYKKQDDSELLKSSTVLDGKNF